MIVDVLLKNALIPHLDKKKGCVFCSVDSSDMVCLHCQNETCKHLRIAPETADFPDSYHE